MERAWISTLAKGIYYLEIKYAGAKTFVRREYYCSFAQSSTNGTLRWRANEIAQAVYNATGSAYIPDYVQQYLTFVFGIDYLK